MESWLALTRRIRPHLGLPDAPQVFLLLLIHLGDAVAPLCESIEKSGALGLSPRAAVFSDGPSGSCGIRAKSWHRLPNPAGPHAFLVYASVSDWRECFSLDFPLPSGLNDVVGDVTKAENTYDRPGVSPPEAVSATSRVKVYTCLSASPV
jgi:hypothetical protein